jgi:hypothetical protein
MKTTGYEYYYKIKGLSVPAGVEKDEIEFEIYKFTGNAEKITEQIKNNFQNGNKDFFYRNLMITIKMLRLIYAKQLEFAAETLLKAAKTGQTDICRKSIPIFSNSLLALSNELVQGKNN